MKRFFFPLLLSLALFFVSCDRTPNGVLNRKQMEDLLVDVHQAEGMMDERGQDFRSQEKRQEVMKGVLEKHHVTQADFDSSLVWYGAHLDQYMKVYGKVIQRLEGSSNEAREQLFAYEKSLLTPEGDSVDIWKTAPQRILDPALLASDFDFTIKVDTNFKSDDTLAWSMRFINLPPDSVARTLVTFGLRSQGKIAELEERFVTEDGLFEIGFRAPKYAQGGEVFGNVTQLVQADTLFAPLYIDQISLMRYRLKEDLSKKDSTLNVAADSLAADSVQIVEPQDTMEPQKAVEPQKSMPVKPETAAPSQQVKQLSGEIQNIQTQPIK